MKYSKHTVNNITVHIVEDDIKNLRLLQASGSKCKLSALRYGTEKPKAIINCSYFTSTYAIGRNQGDVLQDTSSFIDKGWLGFAITENGYKCGELEWWDVEKSICGFTPSCICIKDGLNVEMATVECGGGYSKKMNLATCVSMMGITKEKKCLLVTCEKGLSGYGLKDFLKKNYELEFLCILDGGGSTEMIIDGEIKQKSTDGTERAMFNGLAFIEDEDYEMATLCFRDYKGRDVISAITTHNLEGSHINLVGANDFNGRGASDQVDLLAPCKCKVMAITTYDNTIFFESVNKVKTPNGISKIWFMCTHMNDVEFKAFGHKVGKIYEKGQPLYTEGNKSLYGGGYHIHMEQGFGSFSGGSTPYAWNGQYFKLDGKEYKQYIPCTNGKELSIEKVFYLADVEIIKRASTESVPEDRRGKTILDYYPMVFEPKEALNEPTKENDDIVIMELTNSVNELKLQCETERKLREIAEEGVKQRDEQIDKLKAIIVAIDDLIKGAK